MAPHSAVEPEPGDTPPKPRGAMVGWPWSNGPCLNPWAVAIETRRRAIGKGGRHGGAGGGEEKEVMVGFVTEGYPHEDVTLLVLKDQDGERLWCRRQERAVEPASSDRKGGRKENRRGCDSSFER